MRNLGRWLTYLILKESLSVTHFWSCMSIPPCLPYIYNVVQSFNSTMSVVSKQECLFSFASSTLHILLFHTMTRPFSHEKKNTKILLLQKGWSTQKEAKWLAISKSERNVFLMLN